MPRIETEAGSVSFSFNGATAGPDDGACAIVLVHGAGGQARDWPSPWRYRMNVLQSLGIASLPESGGLGGGPVYALDLPGHGNAPGPAPRNVEAYADAVEAFIAKMNLARPIVVGHSMGGAIAVTLAGRKTANLGGIVVLGSAARLPVTGAITDGLVTEFVPTVAMIVKAAWSRTAPTVYREIGRRHMLAAGPETVQGDFVACNGYDATELLSTIACPALVIAGGGDRMVPAKASRALSEQIVGSRYVEIDGGGHFFHFEHPEATAAEIRRFVWEIGRSTA